MLLTGLRRRSPARNSRLWDLVKDAGGVASFTSPRKEGEQLATAGLVTGGTAVFTGKIRKALDEAVSPQSKFEEAPLKGSLKATWVESVLTA